MTNTAETSYRPAIRPARIELVHNLDGPAGTAYYVRCLDGGPIHWATGLAEAKRIKRDMSFYGWAYVERRCICGDQCGPRGWNGTWCDLDCPAC